MLRFQVEVCDEDFMGLKLKRKMQLSFTLCNSSDYFSSHPDIKLMLQNANRLCNTIYNVYIIYSLTIWLIMFHLHSQFTMELSVLLSGAKMQKSK